MARRPLVPGGLGLGLAICRGIVDAHGGRIAVSSDGRGAGATFHVELATVPPPAIPEPSVTRADAFEPRPALRVLFVEDNADTREAVSRLRAEGFVVETAGDVRSAMAMAGSSDFDVLVSDIGLPDGSGLELMRALRGRGGGPIVGIALSGYGHDEDVRLSREAGFVCHLVKPLRIRRSEYLHHACGRVSGHGPGRMRTLVTVVVGRTPFITSEALDPFCLDGASCPIRTIHCVTRTLSSMESPDDPVIA